MIFIAEFLCPTRLSFPNRIKYRIDVLDLVGCGVTHRLLYCIEGDGCGTTQLYTF